MDVFLCKRNKVVQTVSCSQYLTEFCWYWTSGSTKMVWWKRCRCCCSFYARLINFVFLLQFIDCLPKAGQQFPLRWCLQKVVFLLPISSWTCVYSRHWWPNGRTTLLHVFTRFVIVFYPSSVKLDASSARMSLLQIKHFPTLWFTDKQFFKFLHKYLVVDLNE